jgi:hypothetical protein
MVHLPSYHCQYTPVELIGAQVKGYMADKGTTLKTAGTKYLMHDVVDYEQIYYGKDCVMHAEDFTWGKIQEPIIIIVLFLNKSGILI